MHYDKAYLAIYILNRVWERLLSDFRLDEMHLVEDLVTAIITEADPPLEPSVLHLLGDVRFWQTLAEVPETT